MGCGASKPKLNDEPDIEGIQVPKSESGYPTPKPPSTRKKEIFSIEDCTTIHENVAKVTLISSTTYEELLAQLTKDLKTDLEKIRAIFYFIGKQNIEKQYYPGIKDPHTPRGYMKLIKLKKGNYQSFFALLCRAAGFPCMILTGKGKSVGYEVGDRDLSDLHSSWNAVYMDGQWRIVHPQWAFTGIAGYNSGRWMKIEEQGKQQREKAKASKGTHVSLIDEFWFLTDPDHFIHFCIADLKEWQLLKEPWTVDKFVDVPYFRIPYFTKSDMTLESPHKAVLVSEKGKVEIKFDHEKDCKSDITYELFFDENQSSGKLPEEDLPRCVFVESTEKEKRLIYRFHVEGVYKTTLFSGESVRSKIVSFKIECNEVSQNQNLFPINPPIGFGFGHTAKDFGLQEPSETTGIVQTDKDKPLDFEFRVDTKHELEARLRHNEFKSEDLQQYIDQKTKDDHVLFNVSVPEHKSNGEYALQIYAKEGNELKNIVNYLLTDKKDDFESESAKREKEKNRLKQQLKNAINGNDPDALEKAITEFEEAKIEDEDGDLPVAKEKLRKLRTTNRLKLQLKNAMNGNDPDALEKAITEFEEAKIEDEDGDLPVAKDKLKKLGKTQAVRRRLKNAIDGDDPDELQAAIAEFESSKIKDKDGDLPRARERLRELQQDRLGDDDMKRLKDNLKRAMDREDIGSLGAAIDECEQNGLESDEQVLEAKQLLVDLYEQALEKAMKERDVDKVQRLVDSAMMSPVADEMQYSEVMRRAERFLKQQARLKRYMGVVLDLKPSTVSEIHRYPVPNIASYDSVVATYLILGEKMAVLKQWDKVRNLLRQSGKKGIIRRIRNFSLEDMSNKQAEKAKGILDKYTLDEVRIVSAGSAAFYVWSSNIVKEELTPEEVAKEEKEKKKKEEDEDEGIGEY